MGLLFEQIDFGRRRKADGEVTVAEQDAGPAGSHGSHRTGDADMDFGRDAALDGQT